MTSPNNDELDEILLRLVNLFLEDNLRLPNPSVAEAKQAIEQYCQRRENGAVINFVSYIRDNSNFNKSSVTKIYMKYQRATHLLTKQEGGKTE